MYTTVKKWNKLLGPTQDECNLNFYEWSLYFDLFVMFMYFKLKLNFLVEVMIAAFFLTGFSSKQSWASENHWSGWLEWVVGTEFWIDPIHAKYSYFSCKRVECAKTYWVEQKVFILRYMTFLYYIIYDIYITKIHNYK